MSVFIGTNTNDTYYASLGEDTLFGGGGDDRLYGGDGTQTLFGGVGRDRLFGGAGDDELHSGSNDSLTEYLNGGKGNDTYVISADSGDVEILGEKQDNSSLDVVDLTAFAISDVISVETTTTDRMVITMSDGNGGTFRLFIRDQSNIESIVLSDFEATSPAAFQSYTALISTPQVAEGTSSDDTLNGNSGDDVLSGLGGDDRIFGGDGNDTLFGNEGRDRIFGGAGDDTIDAGQNDGLNQFVYGGDGNDTYVIKSDSGDTQIIGETETSGDADLVLFDGISVSAISNVEILSDSSIRITILNDTGGSFRVSIRNPESIEVLTFSDLPSVSPIVLEQSYRNGLLNSVQTYTDGNDVIQASNIGPEFYVGGDGRDDIRYTQSSEGLTINTDNSELSTGDAFQDLYAGIEWLRGTNHNDTIISNFDRIYGNAGDDVIRAGVATSDLYGGNGDDIFSVESGGNVRIRDFAGAALDGGDEIDLTNHNISSGAQISISKIGSSTAGQISVDRAEIRVDNAYSVDGTLLLNLTDFNLNSVFDGDAYDTFSPESPSGTYDLRDLQYTDGTAFDYAFSNMGLNTKTGNFFLITPEMTFYDNAGSTEDEFGLFRNLIVGDDFGDDIGVDMITGQGIDIHTWSDGANYGIANNGSTANTDRMINMGAASDVVFAGGGDDRVDGGGGSDAVFGGAGDDIVRGGSYSDMVFGGAGDDLMSGDDMSDVLIGGSGNDTLDGGFALDVLFGGAGDDVLISRSDSGEPNRVVADISNVMLEDGTFVDLVAGDPLPEGAVIRPGFDGVQTNDHMDGGTGADLFVFEFTIGGNNAFDDLFAAGVDPTINTAVDWSFVAGLNDYRHDHWMDGIGNDRISNFEIGVDELAFIGHTVQVHDVQHVDVDNDGFLDTVITLYSDHTMNGTPLSHHNDYLGSVTLMGVVLDTDAATLNADNVVDIPVHLAAMGDVPWVGLSSNNAMIDDYMQSQYGDLSQMDLINAFGSFRTLRLADAYFSTNLETIRLFQDESSELRGYIEGTSGDDTINIEGVGAFVASGAGDDLIIGSDEHQTQFNRDFVDAGVGNDTIYGGRQDDIIFAGDGDDIVVGGFRSKADDNAGDEDLIFGGAGNDTITGGVQGDVIFGGDGDDFIYSGSDIGYGPYNPKTFVFGGNAENTLQHHATLRTMGDALSGGNGSDTFIFDVLNAEYTDENGIVHTIDTFIGTDVIIDFEADDVININFHGATNGGRNVVLEDGQIDGQDVTIVSIWSGASDDFNSINPVTGLEDYTIVETDSLQIVGQVIVSGQNSEFVGDRLNWNDDLPAMDASAYYEMFGL